MARVANQLVLPAELIYHIIALLLPQTRHALFPASDATTRTLVALAVACRTTNPPASEALWRHCAYIESTDRLGRLFGGLRAAHGPRGGRWNLTSLYLAPFGNTLGDLQTALQVRNLFFEVRGTLRRLVIDMPLRSLYPEDDDQGIRAALREGFSLLTGLEEFVSTRDELFLDVNEPEWPRHEPRVWTMWPEIRRLALYNPSLTQSFWRDVIGMPKLESLVLTRADGLGNDSQDLEPGVSIRPVDRAIKLLLVNVSSDQPARWEWEDMDPEGKLCVLTHDIPTSFYGDESPRDLCQDGVRLGATKGDIWDWDGAELERTRQNRPV